MKSTCAACTQPITDDAFDLTDDDELVHDRCPLPGDPVADGSIILGLGSSPAERARAARESATAVDDRFRCYRCGGSFAGCTSSWGILVDGRRKQVHDACMDEILAIEHHVLETACPMCALEFACDTMERVA